MKAIAFDFETHLIEPGNLAPEAVCLSWATSGNPEMETEGVLSCTTDREGCLLLLRSLLHDYDHIIGANVAFDFGVMGAAFPELWDEIGEAYRRDIVEDVQINQRLIDNARGQLGGFFNMATQRHHHFGYSLSDIEKRLLSIDRSEQKKGDDIWRLRYAELDGTPVEEYPEEAYLYALEDSVNTLGVYLEQTKRHGHLLRDQHEQARAAFSLHLMSCWGVHTDFDNIEAFRVETEAQYEEVIYDLQDAGLVRKNGSKDTKKAKALMASVCEESGTRVELTASGVKALGVQEGVIGETFTKEAATPFLKMGSDQCEATGDPLLWKYGQLAALKKTLGSSVPALLKGIETPIQARYQVLQATGRTSCSMGKGGALNGFQMQNPRRNGPERECFISRPGTLFADADFDGLELSTVAQVCKHLVGFSALGRAINNGVDPHLDLAASLLGIPYQEAVARKKEPEIKQARQTAKCGNFGFPGGLGVRTFIQYTAGLSGGAIRLSHSEAENIKRTWLAKWPEFRLYFQYINDQSASGFMDVKHLFSGRLRGLARYCAACNSHFQGLGADGAKAALWGVTEAAYWKPESPFYGCRPAIFVHDQIISEVPQESAHDAAVEMARVMLEECNKYLPDFPTSATPALSKHWCKDVEAVYDAPPSDGGRLVAWDIAKQEAWKVYDTEGKEVKW